MSLLTWLNKKENHGWLKIKYGTCSSQSQPIKLVMKLYSSVVIIVKRIINTRLALTGSARHLYNVRYWSRHQIVSRLLSKPAETHYCSEFRIKILLPRSVHGPSLVLLSLAFQCSLPLLFLLSLLSPGFKVVVLRLDGEISLLWNKSK